MSSKGHRKQMTTGSQESAEPKHMPEPARDSRKARKPFAVTEIRLSTTPRAKNPAGSPSQEASPRNGAAALHDAPREMPLGRDAAVADAKDPSVLDAPLVAGAPPSLRQAGAVLGSLVDLIAEFNSKAKLLDIWTNNKALLVRPREEMIGQRLPSIIGEEAFRSFGALLRRVHASGKAEDMSYTLQMEDGPRFFMARAIAFEPPGRERTIRLLVQDVTEKKRADEQAGKVRDLLANTEEIARVGSWEYDTEAKAFLWSDNMYRLLGLNPPETEAGSHPEPLSRVCEMSHPDDRGHVWQDVKKLIETGEPIENEVRFVTAGGETRIFFTRATPVRDALGNVRRIRGISQDVTEQRAAETKFQKSQKLLAEAEKIAHLGSWELDAGLGTQQLSENLYRLIGADPKGKMITVEEALDRMPAADATIMRKNLQAVIAQGKGFAQELCYRLPNNRVRIFHVCGIPTFDAFGRLTRVVGTSRDITEERKAEQRWRAAEEDYRLLIGSLKGYLVMGLDRYGYVTSRHPGVEQSPGGNKQRLGVHFSSFYPSEDIASEKPRREMEQALREGRFEGEGWRVRSDGSRYWADLVMTPLYDQAGRHRGFATVTHDITERKKAGEELTRRAALLAEAESVAHMGSWELDLKTGQMNWSAGLYDVLGLESAQAAPSFDVLAPLIQNELREKMGEKPPAGTRYPIESQVRWELAGGSFRILHTRAWPVCDEAGEPVRIIGTTEDVTEQHQRQETVRRLSQQLLQIRDEEQRRIARSLHETVVQSLAAIKMNLDMLAETRMKKSGEAERLLESLTGLAEGAIREARTISHLLHPPLLDEAGLYPAIRWYARGFSERSGIATTLEMDPNFGRLPRDIELAVFRVVQEALTNVHRHSKSADAAIRIRRSEAERPAEIRFEIQDHGCGMNVTQMDPADVHLGVGTAGMRERVTQLHGRFEIQSGPDQGTTVSVALPLPALRKGG